LPSGSVICIGIYREANESTSSDGLLSVTPEGIFVKDILLPIGLGVTNSLAWLPDSSGRIFVGQEQGGFLTQLWYQAYTGAEPLHITNDLDVYNSVSLSIDETLMISTQERRESTIYVGESPAVLNDKVDWKLRPISSDKVSGGALSWTAGGKLLQSNFLAQSYVSAADRTSQIPSLEGAFTDPQACGPAGLVIVAKHITTGQNLWGLDLATRSAKQLTFGTADFVADCTPDGKSLLFVAYKASSTWQISELPIEGGSPKELFRGRVVSFPSVSPDGKFLAFGKIGGEGTNASSKFVVQNLVDNSSSEIPAPEGASNLKWTPDGHSLTYLRRDISSDDLYLQPLPSGKPFRLMHFDDEPSSIAAYAWSRDGKKIAVTRARFNDSDIVLFSGFR